MRFCMCMAMYLTWFYKWMQLTLTFGLVSETDGSEYRFVIHMTF